jgi:DNA-binding MarR family transcriptional regulator
MNERVENQAVRQIAALLDEMLGLIGRVSDGDMVQLIHRLDLTLPQMISLHMMKDGPQTVSSLSAGLRLTPGAVSRLVDHMVRKKYVHRAEGEQDRRRKTLCLTGTGWTLLGQIESAHARHPTNAMAALDPALREEFRDVVERVVTALRLAERARMENRGRAAEAVSDADPRGGLGRKGPLRRRKSTPGDSSHEA